MWFCLAIGTPPTTFNFQFYPFVPFFGCNLSPLCHWISSWCTIDCDLLLDTLGGTGAGAWGGVVTWGCPWSGVWGGVVVNMETLVAQKFKKVQLKECLYFKCDIYLISNSFVRFFRYTYPPTYLIDTILSKYI